MILFTSKLARIGLAFLADCNDIDIEQVAGGKTTIGQKAYIYSHNWIIFHVDFHACLSSNEPGKHL